MIFATPSRRISVTQNAPDVHHFPSVFNRDNQPASIVAYIEDDEAPDNI
jgi:hypothetical protein